MINSLTPTQQKFLSDLRDKKNVSRNMNNKTGMPLKNKGLVSWALVGGWHITAAGLSALK